MNKITIVMYHYVRNLKNSRYPNIKGLDYSLFKKQLAFFKQNYNLIKMEDVLMAYENGQELPENAMLLTFDDGYIDHFTFVLPALVDYGIQGSFFIPGKVFVERELLDVNKIHFILASQDIKILVRDLIEQLDYYRGNEFPIPDSKELFDCYAVENRFDDKETIFVKRILQTVLPEILRKKISSNLFKKYINGMSEEQFAEELYMNYDQIKCMKQNGMFLGVHGYDHYWLENLPMDEMKKDIIKGLNSLDGIVDKNNWVMNYPYGSYNENVIGFLKTTGCKIGISTKVRVANISEDNRYALPRLDANDFPPKSDNFVKYR